MKKSNYNIFLKLDDIDSNKYALYNTMYRKYLILNYKEKLDIENILKDLDKSNFSSDEISYLKNLAQIGAIVPNEYNEINHLKVLYNQNKFNNTFCMLLNPTLDCNFRCSYCYENHRNEYYNSDMINRIIKLVENKSNEFKRIEIGWFGGEPLLAIDNIKYLSKEFKSICKKNNCSYEAKMTTNGYLLNDEIISNLANLNINSLQITLDGTKKYHDKKRHLENGAGTYEKVKNNCIKILENKIKITLRTNIDKENYNDILNLFTEIPHEYRKNVLFQASNLFDNNETINFYLIYKKAIDYGYRFYDTGNMPVKCEGATFNSVTIYPNNKLSFCSIAAENNKFFGYLSDDGIIKFNNKELYYNFKSIEPFESNNCTKCVELPMCMGSCVFKKFSDKNVCTKIKGLSLADTIKLHIYNNMKGLKNNAE